MGNQRLIFIERFYNTVARKITSEEFQKRIKDRFPIENFKVIKFTGMGRPLEIECLDCHDHINVNKASNFLAKNKVYGCKNCHGLWRDRENILRDIEDRYDILDTFVKDTHTFYHLRCKACGHERTNTLRGFQKFMECGCKTGVLRNRTPQEFINEVNKKNEEQFELVNGYKNQMTKVKIRHKDCGFIFEAWPHDLVVSEKIHCPKCIKRSGSLGERKVAKILQNMNIPFVREYYLSPTRLRLDFFIELNGRKIGIEYNGMQHYKEVPYFNGSLQERQENDNRKIQYCKEHNIELYVIKYTWNDTQIKELIANIKNKLND